MSPPSIQPFLLNRKSYRHFAYLSLLLLVAALTGCGYKQLQTKGGEAGDLLPSPGATVELGKISVEGEKPLDFNPAVLLKEELTEALADENMLWSGNKSASRFILDAKIVDYEPGNAAKRWLLPGWGSTILGVRGELKAPESGRVAAVIENKRAVYAGGAFTIGAWKTIFDTVADDLAAELKYRINGEGFVVPLVPYSELADKVVRAAHPLAVEVVKVDDLRDDKLLLGEQTAAFGVKMGDIYANRRAKEYLTESLTEALRAAGHEVGRSDAGVTIEGELKKLWVETPATALYWDVTAEIAFSVLVKAPAKDVVIVRDYSSKKRDRTYLYPSSNMISKVVNEAVSDVMTQIQTDRFWEELGAGAGE